MILRSIKQNIIKFKMAYITAVLFAFASYLSYSLYDTIHSIVTKELFAYFYISATVGFIVLEVLLVVKESSLRQLPKIYSWYRLISVLVICSCICLNILIASTVTAQIINKINMIIRLLIETYEITSLLVLGSASVVHITYQELVGVQTLVSFIGLITMGTTMMLILVLIACYNISEKQFSRLANNAQVTLLDLFVRHEPWTIEDSTSPHAALSTGYTYKVLP